MKQQFAQEIQPSMFELRHVRSRADLIRQQSASSITHSNKSPLFRQVSGFYLSPGKEELVDRISLYYVTGWTTPYCHYTSSTLNQLWTKPPGEPMTQVCSKALKCLQLIFPKLLQELKSSEQIYNFHIEGHTDLEFVLTNGIQLWDKRYGTQNYKVCTPGRYFLKDGQIYEIFDPPEKPAIFRIDENGSGHVCLSWNKPFVRAETIAAYRIFQNAQMIKQVDNKTFCYKVTDLLSETSYVFTVAAVNHNGVQGALSEPIEVTTGFPGKAGQVESLCIKSRGASKIELGWQRPLDLGGAPIRSFAVFRNGEFRASPEAKMTNWETWTDTEVETNKSYIYHVVASRVPESDFDVKALKKQLPASLEALPEEPELRGLLTDALSDEDHRFGQVAPGIVGKAVNDEPVPKLWDNESHIMLQAFNWESCYHYPSWFSYLIQQLGVIKDACITLMWLPPPTQSVSPQGYMPTCWYNLNTDYGTEVELLDLIESLRAHNISPMLDFVVNHRCGTSKDENGEWTIFEDPHWKSWAIVKNNLVGYRGLGDFDTGQQSTCAPDIDHTNQQVRKDIKEWISWLNKVVGFGSIRIDMAAGYAPRFQVEYINQVNAPFSVAEFWSGDVSVLKNYIQSTRGLIAVYDFALYYILRRSIEKNTFYEMNDNGRLPGVVGSDPERAVTFIENHDTSHLNFVGKFAGGNPQAILRGMVYILTHPGTPCIFWDHLVDPRMRETVAFLCQLRKQLRLTSRCGVHIAAATNGLYAAYISRDRHCSHGGGQLAVKIGTNDWTPEGGFNYRISGEHFCVWSK